MAAPAPINLDAIRKDPEFIKASPEEKLAGLKQIFTAKDPDFAKALPAEQEAGLHKLFPEIAAPASPAAAQPPGVGSTLRTIGRAISPITTPSQMREKIEARGPVTPTELLMDAVFGAANIVFPGEAWWARAGRVAAGAAAGGIGAALEGKPIGAGVRAGAIPMIAGEVVPPAAAPLIGAYTGLSGAEKVATQAAKEAAEARATAGTKAAEKAGLERTAAGEELGNIADKQRRIEAAAREKATETVGKTATEMAETQVKEQSIRELQDTLGLTPEQVQTLRAEPDFRAFRQRAEGVKEAYFSGTRSLKNKLGEEFNKILPDNSLISESSDLRTGMQAIRGELAGKPPPTPGAQRLLDQFQEKFRGGAGGTEAMSDWEVVAANESAKAANQYMKYAGPETGAAETATGERIAPGAGEALRQRANMWRRLREAEAQGIGAPLKPETPPTTIGDLKTARSQASKLMESANATDRELGHKLTDAIDDQITKTAGLTTEQQAALSEARKDYKQFHDTFTHQLAGAVSHSTNPAEVADQIFGNLKNPTKAEEQVGLQLINQLKANDPQRLPALRAALAEKMITENLSPADFKDVNPALLKAVFGQSDYARIEPWFQTKLRISEYENRIKASPEMQRAWQNEAVKATQTETYHNLESKARELGAKMDAAKTPEEAAAIARAELPTVDDAAIKALTELKRGKLHERIHYYAQRYGLIVGLFQPVRAAKIAAGYALAMGPRELFRYALTNPKTAGAFWETIRNPASPMMARRLARMASEFATLKAMHEVSKPTPATPASPPAPGTPTPAPAP